MSADETGQRIVGNEVIDRVAEVGMDCPLVDIKGTSAGDRDMMILYCF